MPKKITQSEFIARMASLHPSLDFSSFTYVGRDSKGTVICPTHGEYTATPSTLAQGCGCPSCCGERRGKSYAMSFADFKAKALQLHPTGFTYNEPAEWLGISHPIEIICDQHGPFRQKPSLHLNGAGCKGCKSSVNGVKCRLTPEAYLLKCQEVHGSRYDLSRVAYIKMNDPVEVVCADHGSFFPRARNFVYRGAGCPRCAHETNGLKKRKPFDSYVSRLRDIYGDTIEYISLDYTERITKINASCKAHGEFTKSLQDLLDGHGCSKCAVSMTDTASFIREATLTHKGAYDYSQVEYTRALDKVTIICPTHGPFSQRPSCHVSLEQGCPTCGKCGPSKGQVEIFDFVNAHTPAVLEEPLGDSRRRLDVFVPSLNLAIEYHGLIWHSDRFRASGGNIVDKHNHAAQLGIRILHVFEDEWRYRPHVVQATILTALGLAARTYARKCTVGLVDHAEASEFLHDHHIQGPTKDACVNYGLYLGDDLLALMSFSRVVSQRGSQADPTKWELRRYASSGVVVGGASRLLKTFTRLHPGASSIVSYSDNRLFTGKMYEQLGFTLDGKTQPSYSYTTSNLRWRVPKAAFQRAKLSAMFGAGYSPELSEAENCRANGWYRIYDCGKSRWLLRA